MRELSANERRAFENSSLAEFEKEMLSSLEIDTALNAIVRKTFNLLHGTTVTLFMRFNDEPQLVFAAAIGLYTEEFKADKVIIGRGLLGSIAQTGIPEIINDANHDPRGVQVKGTAPVTSHGRLMAAPLIAYGRVLGVIGIWRDDEAARFEQHDLDILEEFAGQAVVAVENARLYSEAQSRITQLSILTEISRTLAGTIGLDDMLEAVLAQMGRIFDTTNFFVVIYREGDAEWVQRLNIEHGQRLPVERYLITEGATGYMLRTRNSMLLGTQEEWFAFHRENGMQTIGEAPCSWMGIPLVAGDEINGAMVMQSYQAEHLYREGEMELFSLIGTQVAFAVQNARLYDEAKRRADEMSALVECGTEVTASLKLQTVLERIAARANGMLTKDATAVYLVDELHKKIRPVVALGKPEGFLASEYPVGAGIVGTVASAGIGKIGTEAEDGEEERIMAMPMVEGGTVIGVLAVWRKLGERSFDGFDVAFSAGLARQATVAISNARAFELAQIAKAEAEEANLLKTQFLANMSHELRTPLNAIINFAYLLKVGSEGDVNSGQQDMLDRVEHAGQHLLGLVNDVLDLAKIEAGKIDLALEEVDLPDLCSGICATLGGALREKPVKLLNRVNSGFPPVRADRMRLRQVLLNLLSNAVKFTERGHVILDAEASDDYITISISDTGIGIAPSDLNKIFQDFVQVDGNMNRQTGGSGLGLSISKRFVELHGGSISAVSSFGVGSTFSFTLPRKIGQSQQEALS